MSGKEPLLKFEIDDAVRRKIESHCFSAVDHEVGGFLVGTVVDGVTTISGMIASTKAKSDQANLTFTHEAWDEAYAELHEKFGEQSLVGWYHSHPGYGVFLSDYDAFIQHNFFADPAHVALVIDPLAAETGWFVSRDGEIRTVLKEETQREALKPANRDASGKPKVVGTQTGDNRVALLTIAVAFSAVLFGGIGFWLGSGQSGTASTPSSPQLMLPQLYRVDLDAKALSYLKTDRAGFAQQAMALYTSYLAQLGVDPAIAEQLLTSFNPDLGNVNYLLLPLDPLSGALLKTADLYPPAPETSTATAETGAGTPTETVTGSPKVTSTPTKTSEGTPKNPLITPKPTGSNQP